MKNKRIKYIYLRNFGIYKKGQIIYIYKESLSRYLVYDEDGNYQTYVKANERDEILNGYAVEYSVYRNMLIDGIINE